MYACVCLGLREEDVCEAAEDARTVSEVFGRLGGRPHCGKCVARVRALVRGTVEAGPPDPVEPSS